MELAWEITANETIVVNRAIPDDKVIRNVVGNTATILTKQKVIRMADWIENPSIPNQKVIRTSVRIENTNIPTKPVICTKSGNKSNKFQESKVTRALEWVTLLSSRIRFCFTPKLLMLCQL